jgi:hypothetical protein
LADWKDEIAVAERAGRKVGEMGSLKVGQRVAALVYLKAAQTVDERVGKWVVKMVALSVGLMVV